jgi:hypothetical protein
VERDLAEKFGVPSLASVETEVKLGNDECSGHTLNRWQHKFGSHPFTSCSRGCCGSTRCAW